MLAAMDADGSQSAAIFYSPFTATFELTKLRSAPQQQAVSRMAQLETMTDPILFVTTMPSSRPADYYLGYMYGCVFLDFNNYGADRVSLLRISFDGYGCCELGKHSIPLSEDDSRTFKDIFKEDVKEQSELLRIVKQAIGLNKKLIWADALEEYGLI